MAKATPAHKAAGQTPTIPRHPAKAQTTQNGTSTENGVSWRPTIADKSPKSKSVTDLSARMGVPKAPKATGAVFAINDSPEAANGLKPS